MVADCCRRTTAAAVPCCDDESDAMDARRARTRSRKTESDRERRTADALSCALTGLSGGRAPRAVRAPDMDARSTAERLLPIDDACRAVCAPDDAEAFEEDRLGGRRRLSKADGGDGCPPVRPGRPRAAALRSVGGEILMERLLREVDGPTAVAPTVVAAPL